MRTTVVLVLHNQLGLTRACLDSLRSTSTPLSISVVDNASSDGTEAYLCAERWPWPLAYARNADNVGLIRALNQGARRVETEFVCFLHNDTEMHTPDWLARLEAAATRSEVGLAGLYGARALRRDGRFVGRSIVHCLVGGARMPGPIMEVAAVDGVCLFLRRSMLDAVGGFDEGYGFFHGYDRDLSLAVRAAGRRCVVVDAPFVHRGGGTRTGPAAPRRPEEDLADRRAALARFASKWARRLPCDVRSTRERLAGLWGRR